MNKLIETNTEGLQEILRKVSELPNSGMELPELSNPAKVTEVFSGAEYIDETGAKKTGTFTIDSELNTQHSLISQIQAALEGKAAGSGSSGDGNCNGIGILATMPIVEYQRITHKTANYVGNVTMEG